MKHKTIKFTLGLIIGLLATNGFRDLCVNTSITYGQQYDTQAVGNITAAYDCIDCNEHLYAKAGR